MSEIYSTYLLNSTERVYLNKCFVPGTVTLGYIRHIENPRYF